MRTNSADSLARRSAILFKGLQAKSIQTTQGKITMKKNEEFAKIINKLNASGLDDVFKRAKKITFSAKGLSYSIKKLLDDVQSLENAIAKNDHVEIGRVLFRIKDLLNYLYVGLGGEKKK
jgi:hypothetical protein